MVAYEPFLSLVFAPVPVYSNCELFSNICSQLLIVNVWKNVRRLNTFTISLLTVNLKAKRTTFSTKLISSQNEYSPHTLDLIPRLFSEQSLLPVLFSSPNSIIRDFYRDLLSVDFFQCPARTNAQLQDIILVLPAPRPN